MSMILLIIQMLVLSEKRVELSQTIASLIVSIRAQKGCDRCEFCQSMDNENELWLLGEWDTRENLEGYLGSQGFKILHGAANLLKRPYDLTFYTLFNPGGNGGGLANDS